jgi:hypothetical protein
MNKLLLILATIVSTFAYADQLDSMMVFQRPTQVTVVINESGQGKLVKLFDLFGTNLNEFTWSTTGYSSADIIVNCKRVKTPSPEYDPYSCRFTFSQSSNVQINGNLMSAAWRDISTDVMLDVSFKNALTDAFNFKFMSDGLTASSIKK